MDSAKKYASVLTGTFTKKVLNLLNNWNLLILLGSFFLGYFLWEFFSIKHMLFVLFFLFLFFLLIFVLYIHYILNFSLSDKELYQLYQKGEIYSFILTLLIIFYISIILLEAISIYSVGNIYLTTGLHPTIGILFILIFGGLYYILRIKDIKFISAVLFLKIDEKYAYLRYYDFLFEEPIINEIIKKYSLGGENGDTMVLAKLLKDFIISIIYSFFVLVVGMFLFLHYSLSGESILYVLFISIITLIIGVLLLLIIVGLIYWVILIVEKFFLKLKLGKVSFLKSKIGYLYKDIYLVNKEYVPLLGDNVYKTKSVLEELLSSPTEVWDIKKSIDLLNKLLNYKNKIINIKGLIKKCDENRKELQNIYNEIFLKNKDYISDNSSLKKIGKNIKEYLDKEKDYTSYKEIVKDCEYVDGLLKKVYKIKLQGNK